MEMGMEFGAVMGTVVEDVMGTVVEPGVRSKMDTGLVMIRALVEVRVALVEVTVLVEERLDEEAETTIVGQEVVEVMLE